VNSPEHGKLFFIEQIEDGAELVIRLVTQGAWQIAATGQFSKISSSAGFSVWTLRQGKPHPFHCSNIAETVELCLRTTEFKGE
jgi:hypothetical protein